jgi:valyl-tRNA synthetase
MLSEYPVPRTGWIDQAKMDEMIRLQELITAIRTARAENNVGPRAELDIQLRCKGESRRSIESQLDHLAALVRARQVEFVEGFQDTGVRVLGVSQLAEFSLTLEDVVDVEAERNRLVREKVRIISEIERLEKKLRNESFLTKAPAEVVEKTRSRHREALEHLGKMERSLEQFGAD